MYCCTQFKATVKPNTAPWPSLFLDVHLHVQAAVFFPMWNSVCEVFIFSIKKKNTPHPLFLLHYYTPY